MLVIVVGVLIAGRTRPPLQSGTGDNPLDGSIILRTPEDYDRANRAAANFSKGAFDAIAVGDQLTPTLKKNLIQAARLYDAMTSYKPSNYLPDFTCGECLHALEMHDPAILKLRQFIAGVGEHPVDDRLRVSVADSRGLIANSLTATHNYKAALVEANIANDMYPKTTAFLVERASAEMQLKDTAQAKIDLDEAISVSDPSDPAKARAEQMLALLAS